MAHDCNLKIRRRSLQIEMSNKNGLRKPSETLQTQARADALQGCFGGGTLRYGCNAEIAERAVHRPAAAFSDAGAAGRSWNPWRKILGIRVDRNNFQA